MALQNGKRIAAELRRYEVLQMKIAGASERAIAERVGVSNVQVHNDVKRVLEDLAKRNEGAADRIRALQMERYDRLLLSWWQRALDGNEQAAGVVLNLLKQISIINGIIPDKPLLIDQRTQIQVNQYADNPGEYLQRELNRIIARTAENESIESDHEASA